MTTVVGIIDWLQATSPTPSPTSTTEVGGGGDNGGDILTDTFIVGVVTAVVGIFVGVLSYFGNRRSNKDLVDATKQEIAASNQRHEQEIAASNQRHEQEIAASNQRHKQDLEARALEAQRVDTRHEQEIAASNQRHGDQLRTIQAEADQTNDREWARVRTERFGRAADQMGSDEPLVRMAGVYAMAALADEYDDQAQRQNCIDVLCGYLRLPPPVGTGSADLQPGEEQVRLAIVDTITEHCQKVAPIRWSDLSFDFRGVEFPWGTSFSGARFRLPVDFTAARFRAQVDFSGVRFKGRARFVKVKFDQAALFGSAKFRDAEFADACFGDNALFAEAEFYGTASFQRVQFRGKAGFGGAKCHGEAGFYQSEFWGVAVFAGAQFSKSAEFSEARFAKDAWFKGADFRSNAMFDNSCFDGGTVSFSKVSNQTPIDLRKSRVGHGQPVTFIWRDNKGSTQESDQPPLLNP